MWGSRGQRGFQDPARHQLATAAIGTHQITKVAHWGTNMGISVADEIRNCTNLGYKARWIVGHEEPAKVPRHQIGLKIRNSPE